MSCRDRYKSIQDFRDQDDMRVFVVSLKAGGTGLDMPMASKCILVDLWWNEAVQDQVLKAIIQVIYTEPEILTSLTSRPSPGSTESARKTKSNLSR